MKKRIVAMLLALIMLLGLLPVSALAGNEDVNYKLMFDANGAQSRRAR